MSESKKTRMDVLTETIAAHGYDSFTPGERLYFTIWWFMAETNNGGLHQFFFNDAGAYAADAFRSLELVGASKTADILRRAMMIFPESRVPTDILERRELLCDLPDELQWGRIGELTTELFQTREPIAEGVEDYIRQHPDEFARFQQLYDVA
jgi:hypothetical protein